MKKKNLARATSRILRAVERRGERLKKGGGKGEGRQRRRKEEGEKERREKEKRETTWTVSEVNRS